MYLSISDPEEYTDNKFGVVLQKLMEKTEDAIVIYENYLFIVKIDTMDTFSIDFLKIIKRDYDGDFKVEIIKENVKAESYKHIAYRIMQLIREKEKHLKDVDFQVEKFKFKGLIDSNKYIYTE